MKAPRVIGAAVVLVGVVFAFSGGEYSTLDWWSLRTDNERVQDDVEKLEIERDSLAIVADALENDSATQERVAREAFGMARPGEILYRVERP